MTFLEGVIPKLTERSWQGQVLGLARMFGWAFWHDNATNAPRVCPRCKLPVKQLRNAAGWPDLFLIKDDTLIVAELKSDRNKPTPEQRDWLEAFSRVRRVRVFVWQPKHSQSVADILGGNESAA